MRATQGYLVTEAEKYTVKTLCKLIVLPKIADFVFCFVYTGTKDTACERDASVPRKQGMPR
jgi:hypothetical protein